MVRFILLRCNVLKLSCGYDFFIYLSSCQIITSYKLICFLLNINFVQTADDSLDIEWFSLAINILLIHKTRPLKTWRFMRVPKTKIKYNFSKEPLSH